MQRKRPASQTAPADRKRCLLVQQLRKRLRICFTHMCWYAVQSCTPCEFQQDFKQTLRRSSSCDCTAAGPIILAARATASALAASRAALALALSTFACTCRGRQRLRTVCTCATAAACIDSCRQHSCFQLCDRRGPHRQSLAAFMQPYLCEHTGLPLSSGDTPRSMHQHAFCSLPPLFRGCDPSLSCYLWPQSAGIWLEQGIKLHKASFCPI